MAEFDKDTNVRSNEYINKAELIKEVERKLKLTSATTTKVIDSLPTIDIVYCGECIHFRKGWTKCKMLNLNGADSDWFCADGARKSVKEVSNKPTLKHADKETLQSAT